MMTLIDLDQNMHSVTSNQKLIMYGCSGWPDLLDVCVKRYSTFVLIVVLIEIECSAVIVLDRMWCCHNVTCWIECGAVTV